VRPGTGKDKPARWDDVTYTYTSWDTTGKMLDSPEMLKRPKTSAPFREPKGIEEALTGMVVGERSRFWIPGELARKSSPPATGMFTFEIEVTEIKKKPAPPATPKDVAAIPGDAKTTASGLGYRVIKAGSGKVKPTAAQAVKVDYTGWTTDGKLFDSSVLSGNPAEFALNGVIAGWTEGLQLMVVGETTRLWIPEALAYKGAPGKPQGMLVFDVTLLEVKDAPPRAPMGHGPGGPKPPGGFPGGKLPPGMQGGRPGMPGRSVPPPAPGQPGAPPPPPTTP